MGNTAENVESANSRKLSNRGAFVGAAWERLSYTLPGAVLGEEAMSQSPGNAGGTHASYFGCGCLSSLALFVGSGVLIGAFGRLDFFYFLLGLSVLMGFVTLFLPRNTPTETYPSGR